MQDFKHDLTSMRDECNCPLIKPESLILLEYSLVLLFLGTGMRIDLLQSCDHCWVFQICWLIECVTLMAMSFRLLNSSTGISLHPLALLTAVLLKVYLASPSRMSDSGWLTTSWNLYFVAKLAQANQSTLFLIWCAVIELLFYKWQLSWGKQTWSSVPCLLERNLPWCSTG